MKQVSTELAQHLAGGVTTLATCWKLTRRDGVVMGFTNHDRDLEIEAVSYRAATGFTPSAIENTGAFSVDNLDVEGMLVSGSITEADIMAGMYDFADISIFQVNYLDISQGVLPLKQGWLGEVSLRRQQFVAEVRGMTQCLSQTIGELYSPSCRAALGDGKCRVNLAAHTVSGALTSVASRQIFEDEARDEASGIFSAGVITFTGGNNQGMRMEVKEYVRQEGSGGRFVLALPMSYALAPGDTYSLVKGCDKTMATCQQRFSNLLNYRGEPHVPGLDRMLETAGTRSS